MSRERDSSSPKGRARRATTGPWRGAAVVVPLRKHAISLRVDEDVLAWFRAHGPRYQSRMNAVLRSYMDAVSITSRRRRGG